MNAIQLHFSDGKPAGVWYCSNCKCVARSQELAEQCCAPRKCSACGEPVREQYRTLCEDCRKIDEETRERDRFSKAEKLAEWKGWVWDPEGRGWKLDGFSESVEEFLEYLEDQEQEIPEYVWACKPVQFVHGELADITDKIIDNAYEDFDVNELDGLWELKAAIEKFNELNKDVVSYEPDYSKAVLLPKKATP